MEEYIISKIIYCEKTKNNKDYYLICKSNNKKICGYTDFTPMKGDIIKCNLTQKKNSKKYDEIEYTFIKKDTKFFLPNNENMQQIRLLELFNGNNKLINSYNKFTYGNNFWINIYKLYLDLQASEDTNIDTSFNIVIEHITNYIDSLIDPFIKKLNEYNIKLNNKQYMFLYTHPQFGFDIASWTIDDILLLYNIKGFGNKTIMMIANGLKFSIENISILIIYGIINNNDNGHTYKKYNYNDWLDEIIIYTKDINLISKDNFNNIIENLINKKMIIQINDNILCCKKLYNIELSIAETLINILYLNYDSLLNLFKLRKQTIDNYLNDYGDDGNMLDDEQKQGIVNAFLYNISIIHGQAGTGKSTLLKGLIKTIEEHINKNIDNNLSIFFLTPTAKAMMRIKDIISEIRDDITKYHFYTLQGFNIRLLYELIKLNKYNILIIDETSMVDIELMNMFLELIKSLNCTIILLGDYRQLPSISVGNLLYDLIFSKKIPSTELIKTYRYDTKQTLKKIINKVLNNQKINELDVNDSKEFILINPNNNNDYTDHIKSNCKDNDIIITPINNNIYKYTDIIRDIKNPLLHNDDEQINEIKYYNKCKKQTFIFRINDDVICIHNEPKEDLFNGMIATIYKIYNDKTLKIKRKDNNKIYTIDLLEDGNKNLLNYFLPSYMISVHKSQGQEYNNILILLTPSIMLNNKLLYTAITRATAKVTIISDINLLNNTIKKNNKRNTLLKTMINYKYLKHHNEIEIDFNNYYILNNQDISDIYDIKGIDYILDRNTDYYHKIKNGKKGRPVYFTNGSKIYKL